MADKNILEQMLGHLVNDDKQKAEELFHEYVVAKSREIYESLIESEMEDEDGAEAKKEDDLDESSEDEAKKEDDLDEEFEDIAFEGDDEEGGDAFSGEPDQGDDLAGELDAEGGEGEMSDKEPEELFQDLDAIVDELQAKFDAMNGGEMGDEMDDEMDGEMGPEKEDFDLETVREYVEKVTDGHGAEKKGKGESADNNGMKFSKNDMGGTAANILSGRNGAEAGEVGQPGGKVKGSALSDVSPKDMNTGNLNTVGGFKGDAFKKNGAGHGAEKKGASEGSTEGQSLFRGRR